MSLLLTAGLIVFVNRVQNFQVALEAARKSEQAERDKASYAQEEAAVIRASAAGVRDAAWKENALLRRDLAAARKETRDRMDQIAQLNAQIESLKSVATSATAALD